MIVKAEFVFLKIQTLKFWK